MKFSFVETHFAQIWSPTGLSLVIVLFFGVRFLPAVFIGTAANYIMISGSVPLGFVFAIGSTVEAAIGFYLLGKAGFDARLLRLRDIWYLFSIVGLLSTLAGAVICVTAVGIMHPQMWDGYISYVGLWWFGNLVGALIVTPLLLQLINAVKQQWTSARIAEYIFLLILLLVIAYVIFHARYFKEYLNYSFVYLVFPFTIWCSIRFGMTGAATSVYLVSLNAVISTQTQTGLFAAESYTTSIVLLDGFLVMLSMTSLGLAALVAERDAAERLLRRSEENYRIVAEHTGQLVYDYTISTGHILWSGAIEDVTQYTATEFCSFDISLWENNIHPYDRSQALVMLGEAMNKKTEYNVEYRFKRKDGSYIDILDRGTFLYAADGTAYRMLGTMADITEIKQADVKLKESEERYRLFSLLASDYVYSAVLQNDGTFRTEWASPAFERVTGYTIQELNQEHGWTAIIDPDDLNRIGDSISMIRSGLSAIIEYRIKTKEGNIKWLRDYIQPIVDPSSNAVLLYTGGVQDITERKRIEDELRNSEERFRAIANAITVPLIISRLPDGKVLYANRYFADSAGLMQEDVIGSLTPSFYQKSEDRERLMSILAAKGRVTNFEVAVTSPSGRKGTVVISAELTTFQGENAVVATFYDVTQRKKLEQALSESEERFRVLVEKSTDGICLFDRRLRLLYATPSVEKMVGYSVDELKGMNILAMTDPADRKVHRKNIHTLFHMDGSVASTQVRFRHKNGSWVYLEGSLTNFIHDPRIHAIVCNFRNVTDRVHAEDRIHRSLQEKEILLKEVHHRVKNNMQVVSSLLNLHSSSIKNTRVRSIFLESQNRVKSMALVHEILYQTKDLARVNMMHYTKKLIAVIQQSFAAQAKFVAIAPKIANINLDVDAAIPCGLIINELVTNALKHAFAAGKTGKISIVISQRNSSHVVLTVHDDGKGLPKGFTAAEHASLGLTLVQALVEQLKGTLSVTVKRGTAFSVTFPIVNETLIVS
ncbi:MAG: PAS domain S-box protein [Ignavibacteriales bacterium]|nr:PAS domain S-box protein [Ignavibacteriales bacterium]